MANELLGLGSVRHLVSPNQFHYAHIGEWATAFPNTVSWASPRLRKEARARNVDVDFKTSRPVRAKNGVEKSIKRFFPAVIFGDLHR
jgi:hypothetical protein